jgi:hypothetical protein
MDELASVRPKSLWSCAHVRVPWIRAGRCPETLLRTLNGCRQTPVSRLRQPEQYSDSNSTCVGKLQAHPPTVCTWTGNPFLWPLLQHPFTLARSPPRPPRCALSFTVCSPRPVQPLTTNPLPHPAHTCPPLVEHEAVSLLHSHSGATKGTRMCGYVEALALRTAPHWPL